MGNRPLARQAQPDWDPRFFAKSPRFSTIAEAGREFRRFTAFPSPEEIDACVGSRAGVRFVSAPPKPRRGRRKPAETPYDARITNEGIVPTRPGSWHDLLNALVWATFPRAKRALHARQHARIVPGAPCRTRELDALALVDEGGVIVVDGDDDAHVFGHALYEGVVRGWPAPFACVMRIPAPPMPPFLSHTQAAIDVALAAVLASEAVPDPRDLPRLKLGAEATLDTGVSVTKLRASQG